MTSSKEALRKAFMNNGGKKTSTRKVDDFKAANANKPNPVREPEASRNRRKEAVEFDYPNDTLGPARRRNLEINRRILRKQRVR